MDVKIVIAPSERHTVEHLSDLYSVLMAMEKLEKAFHRDLVTSEQYNAAVERLFDKYDRITMQLAAQKLFTSLDAFTAEYNMNCPGAKTCILNGRPSLKAAAAAAAAADSGADMGLKPKTILEAGQHFITLMDCLKLGQRAKDQLHPILVDLIATVEKINGDLEVLPKLRVRREQLDAMPPFG